MSNVQTFFHSLLGFFLCCLLNPAHCLVEQDYSSPQPIGDVAYFRDMPSPLSFRPDVSFVIADIKYRDDALKILEFGEGPRSRFNGFDNLYGKGKIWNNFWHYLKGLGLSVWFVKRNLKRTTSFENDNPFKSRIDYKAFVELGGSMTCSLKTLEHDPIFQELHKSERQSFFGSYKGLIIIKSVHKKHFHNSTKLCKQCSQLKAFKAKYQDFLIMDDASRVYVTSKKRSNDLFEGYELEPFRPLCRTYSKVYRKDLAEKIEHDFRDSPLIVIKPLNATKGNGVIICEKRKLDKILQYILIEKGMGVQTKDMSYRYWSKDRNKRFIVESYEPSKIITVAGKEYDATMRVVFALHHDTQKMYVTFLGSYWKLPLKSLNEHGTLNDRSKSAISKNRASSAVVAEEDAQKVYQILSKVLPKVYENMLCAKRNYV